MKNSQHDSMRSGEHMKKPRLIQTFNNPTRTQDSSILQHGHFLTWIYLAFQLALSRLSIPISHEPSRELISERLSPAFPAGTPARAQGEAHQHQHADISIDVLYVFNIIQLQSALALINYISSLHHLK